MRRGSMSAVNLVPIGQVDELRKLLDRGLNLQAFQRAEAFGPLKSWAGSEARCFGGQLAGFLGAPQLERRLHLKARRDAPAHPEAFYHHVCMILETRGAWEGWQVLNQTRQMGEPSPRVRFQLLALRARLAGHLRDFETADALLAKAESCNPDPVRLLLERAHLLEKQDRYEEALTAAREALSSQAGNGSAVQVAAHLLQLLDRDAEALELLEQAAKNLESASLMGQLAQLQIELGQPAKARESLEKFAEFTPLREHRISEWLAAKRAEAAYKGGDFTSAARFAREARGQEQEEFARRCDEAAARGDTIGNHRHLLAVPFVRQHHVTCAPATLTALSRFWGKPADQRAVAGQICYNGTASHSEREWAEQNGWIVKEFRLTSEAGKALIDREVPFGLATSAARMGHMQAVAGYDSMRDSLLIRDPYLRNIREFPVGPFLEASRSTGPQALVLVPADKAGLLEGLELPEASLYDRFHQIQLALDRNEREKAQSELAALETEAPGHRLALTARRALAGYDGNLSELLATTDKLLAQFPDDANLLLVRNASLRELAPRGDRLAWLKEVCLRPGCDPSLWLEYARELSADARDYAEAHRWLRRASRVGEPCLEMAARLAWDQGDMSGALELLRFAACLDDKNEARAGAYFHACIDSQQADVALRFLKDRFERFGRRSHESACTLFTALLRLWQPAAAYAVLDLAMEWRPADPHLLLFSAHALADRGEFGRCHALLESAKPIAQRTAWHRCAADVAQRRGYQTDALEHWRKVLELEPSAPDAHRAVAALLTELDCPASGLQHLEKACARFPHSFGLRHLHFEWLANEAPEVREADAQRLIEINPVQVAGHLCLAQVRREQRRYPEALAAVEAAVQLAPDHPGARTLRGWIHLDLGQRKEALADFRKAVNLSIESSSAIKGLLETSTHAMDHVAALSLIEGSLTEKRVSGDGLLSFRAVAQTQLKPEELLRLLQKVLSVKSECWQAWSAVVNQLADLNQLDPALNRAREAAGKFPNVPQVHFDLGRILELREKPDEAVAEFLKALEFDPSFVQAQRSLAVLYERSGRLNEARLANQQALERFPLDAVTHGFLAVLQQRLGEKREAMDSLRQAARIDLNYEWAWHSLRMLGLELKQPDADLDLARALTRERPSDPRTWLALCRVLDASGKSAEALKAIEQAIGCDPRCADAHDAKANLLLRLGRCEAAAKAARPDEFAGHLPASLRVRAAMIDAQRGQAEEALARFQEILKEYPDYFGGWRELAHWHRARNDYDGALEAANQMQRLAPLDANVACFLGRLEASFHHHESARSHFRHALQCDPTNEDGALALFDLHFGAGEYRQAEEVLASLRQRTRTFHVAVREIWMTLYQGDAESALQIFRSVCESPVDDGAAFKDALDAVTTAGLDRFVTKIIEQALEGENPNPSLGSHWVLILMRQGRLPSLSKLNKLQKRGEIGRRAVLATVQLLAGAGREDKHFKRSKCRRVLGKVLRSHGDWLSADEAGWLVVGSALTDLEDTGRALSWLKGWENRTNLTPTILHDLVINLKRVGREKEVAAVCRRAMDLSRDGATPFLELWLAQEEALAGDFERAGKRLDKLRFDTFNSYFQQIFVLVRSLVEVGRSPAKDRTTVYRNRFKDVEQVFGRRILANSDRPACAAFHRTMTCLADLSGGWRLRAWAAIRMH